MALQDLGSLASGLSVNDAIESYLARLSQGEPPAPTVDTLRVQSEAVVEIMFLVAAVDGVVADVELEQLRESVFELSTVGVLAVVDADVLVPALRDRLAKEGWSARMHAAAAALAGPEMRTLAFRLGAGVAFVDDHVESAEAAALDAIAKTLELTPEQAHDALADVQRMLFG
jgi:uncharacterized tellurite resistance protein B-like protein